MSCLGTTIGTVLIGVQPVLGLTWVLIGDANITSPPLGPITNCCSGTFDFDPGTNTYTNVSLVAFGIEVFSAITGTGLAANSISDSTATTVNVTFFSSLSIASPGDIINFTGNGMTSLFGGATFTVSGTVTAQPVPVPYEFESVTGLAILGMGYGLHKLRKRRQQQRNSPTQTPDQQLTSDNSQLSEISEDIESESLAENHRELVNSIKKS